MTTTGQVLVVGGSGNVGRAAVRWLRERHPDVPLLIGGRNLQAASAVAEQAGGAEAVAIDLDAPRLGLGSEVDVSAVVMLAPEAGVKGLAYAQDLGVPFLNTTNHLAEVGPEMALFAHRATAAPVVLAAHWMGGAAVLLALSSAKGLTSVRSITIGVVLDEDDPAGPAALEDMERLSEAAPGNLVFEGGRRVWLHGDALSGEVKAIDGRSLDATAFSPLDIISLHAATGARDVRLDLVTGESSSRRRGGAAAAEIVVEVEGEADGRTRRSRSTLEFPQGAASLTAFSLVLCLSAVMGLDGRAPAQPGLYLPELLLDAGWFLGQLRSAGATIDENAG